MSPPMLALIWGMGLVLAGLGIVAYALSWPWWLILVPLLSGALVMNRAMTRS
jgi:small-conductance mechanosensitive channel